MIKRVLIPLDGSELAEKVVPHLVRLVAAERTEILLISALSRAIPAFADLAIPALDEVITLAGSEIEDSVSRVEGQLRQLGFSVSRQYLLGLPSDCILQMAEEEHIDLIAMSTHGRTGVGRALLGSVADQVVRHTQKPVLLTSSKTVSRTEPSLQTVLVPLDGTRFAESALPFAQRFAQEQGATLLLLRVIEPPNLSEPELMSGSSQSLEVIQESLVKIATSYLERIRRRLQLAGVNATQQVEMGQPAFAITQTANSENVDLIVMSTHGRTGIERLVYGSVASQVIHDATCPILFLHGQETVPAQQAATEVQDDAIATLQPMLTPLQP